MLGTQGNWYRTDSIHHILYTQIPESSCLTT